MSPQSSLWAVCSPVPPTPDAVRLDPVWRTSTVLALAKGIVRDGNFDAMPILADALEDAGCDNTALLEHCRHGTNHAKDCWSLLLILTQASAPAHRPPPPTMSVFVEAAQRMNQPRDRARRVWDISVVILVFVVGFSFVSEMGEASHTYASLIAIGLSCAALCLVYLYTLVETVRHRSR